MREDELTVGVSEFIIIVSRRSHICSLLRLVTSKGNRITLFHFFFLFFIFAPHCLLRSESADDAATHESRENSGITHWPVVSRNLFPSTALRPSRTDVRERSNKTEIPTRFPAAAADPAGIMFSPQNQLLQRVRPALSVRRCATAAPTPAQVNSV